MRLIKGQGWWGLVVICAFAVSWGLFIFFSTRGDAAVRGPGGGSWPGLGFGAAGLACMLFAAALRFRKMKFLRWLQYLSARWWLRGHLWLGIMAVPLILFHAGGLHTGGRITTILMWLLGAVVISGLFGAALQHLLAGAAALRIGKENVRNAKGQNARGHNPKIHREFPRILLELRNEADELVATWRDAAEKAGQQKVAAPDRQGVLLTAAAPTSSGQTPSGETSLPEVDARSEASSGDEVNQVFNFYERDARPFIYGGNFGARRHPFADVVAASTIFDHARVRLSGDARDQLNELERLCNDRRATLGQERAHWWMHSWLVFHAPLAYLLITLSILHAIGAWQYMRR